MGVLASALGVLNAAEAGVIWYIWTRWRSANDLAAGATGALAVAYGKLVEARDALKRQNDLEAKRDDNVVTTSPGLDDALVRVNGLQ